jgi:hypothetical protein
MGDIGGLVFTALALAWGFWQRFQKAKAVTSAVTANTEKEMYKQLSLRPAGVPLISIPTDLLGRIAQHNSMPDPDYAPPISGPPDFETSPTLRAKPGAK